MQLNMQLANNSQIQRSWAFAARDVRIKRPRRKYAMSPTDMHGSVITAVSKEAKSLGVKVGMRYEDAKALVPGMRILVYSK